MKNRRRSFPQVSSSWLFLLTDPYLYFCQLLADVPFPLAERPPDGAKLSFKEKMKLFAQEVKWLHQKNTKFNTTSVIFSFKIRYWWEYLDSCFQVGENTPRDKAKISKAQREIDSVEWTQTFLTMTSGQKWLIQVDQAGTWDWKVLDAEKGSRDVIFSGWSRLKSP